MRVALNSNRRISEVKKICTIGLFIGLRILGMSPVGKGGLTTENLIYLIISNVTSSQKNIQISQAPISKHVFAICRVSRYSELKIGDRMRNRGTET